MRRIQSKWLNVTSESVKLGILLAFVGGFLDAYTFISRDGVFANAQTGNIVLLGVQIAQGAWQQALLHVPPILAFMIGVIVSESFKHPSMQRVFRDPARAILLLESIVLVLVGILPASVPNMVVTVTIAFVASVQVSTFRKLGNWPYNTTMTTGNLRTAIQAAYVTYVTHDRKAATQFRQFSEIIVSFLMGAVIGALLTQYWGTMAVWIAAVLLIFALFTLHNEQEILQDHNNAEAP
ncbi:hypothetical protein BVG16_25215 [Paenibacillus selenitireducens]|uniref:DUF1275 family protein n=1 Tax=Paenibacillus selenitireducens TaxID=1324314 RepID=A0A1T2X2L2_9BACL|nr:YoaK family protein [Paenibacillus selenitireducens]OPA74055.1 hypothetical protein BVG16_25215 [Paenibacillus selenitireducens]